MGLDLWGDEKIGEDTIEVQVRDEVESWEKMLAMIFKRYAPG